MNPADSATRKPSCKCPCHHSAAVIPCCQCFAAGKSACDCLQKRHCCGDPTPTQGLPGPEPPGWRPGDFPLVNPLSGATSDADLQQRFNQAVVELVRSSSSPRG